MRIRTLAALVTGAALGAGGAYLLDPNAGPERRRDALRLAWERSRDVDWAEVLERTGTVVQQLGERAADGYRDGIGTDGAGQLG